MNKFIVLDINHGGNYLAAILKNCGYEVIVYDIYKKGGIIRQELENKNIKVLDSLDGADYTDYIISYPIHCPDFFLSSFSKNKKLTHHELIKLHFKNKKNVVEITGSKGKTTTAHLLAFLLSFEEDILLNSSVGFEKFHKGTPYKIFSNNSISAGYTAKILSEPHTEYLILEESLGVCGISDISILTSTYPIYPIKGGNSTSLEAKKQLFKLSDRAIIIDSKDKIANELANNYNKEIFRIWEDIKIDLPDHLEIGNDINSTIYSENLEINSKLHGSYLAVGYLNPILFSTMALKILNKISLIKSNYLNDFRGVPNRLSVIKETNYTKIIDKSGGFSEDSLRYTLSLLKKNYDMFYKNINLIINLTNTSHCQKIDLHSLDKAVGEFSNIIDNAFLIGNNDFETFKYLKNSAELNIHNGDLLIECGK
ncbi:MAG: UDP-N-acetylmuramoylalanyl-D-glutamate--2,6-diaminopimelate ligase [Candidatus Methanofastidiosum methylothiophilum]|jgi:UDP-N-acetylmuramoylalanine-D-glutamate ligase|uniref:UDP-N-acetylmuramoylalanyl-D-glutamate--2, 6-diaminopimelate ligase n=1 Tax=Candidatus Methanofastidiosum methylothiophilum TaxID=1705564 RepID=A0A150JN05_9EURY|nr:MAG: UDP-N-acetylmuramoylalanyl-D-glutamate--2,6-diaminopimelate ligase [Candidatus Methanofastidiosum methylthiophilus]MBP6932394.1 hypothetical protein [Methanofastidiosum sp.]OQC52268.1 MAG: UDP-N-acetylmuramoylalanyl-D-glutamate--2,6-diaminopimelate ligase [Euryarchaeota archaeon ADurb.Bin023]KYC57613.1 MAG: UDP-N-acetylmuramoylalanyl-D-glutamate--2,6-diaminopimelate ligase [Candidatus Methanofastidiosum methylthiophilus]KYC58498.1 MAG: UDP-N-acetylmuramoylalanyl-D-glutamate--2,6-diamino